MGVITDKLDAEWEEKRISDNIFKIRRIIRDLYDDLSITLTNGSNHFPTGNDDLDSYIDPIVQEIIAFKNQLENNYPEFINWEMP